MQLLRLVKMCMNETYSRVRVGKHLSDIFFIKKGLKNGEAFSPLLLIFGLGYATGKVEASQEG